ncbi:AraC family transcriptional regulator [Pedobacter sp. L105]|uniref:helix-turn-helix domain-containing protein n=1 Tax=Pedobacter sp. L105 TaxID=1641871 RepID=UPI00131AEB4B|nr:AraC family transcriptional regulator [Pedobacter sp. L105]
MKTDTRKLPVQYSCYYSKSRAGEQLVPEHALGYIVSGTMVMSDGPNTATFNKGELYFCRRNKLAKFTKYPPEGGEFRSISIFFEQKTLRNFSLEYGYLSAAHVNSLPFKKLATEGILANYMESLKNYEHVFSQTGAEELLAVKQKEAILILLQFNPELKDILFDFSEPGKIDLEGFMNKNYHFNIELPRFAYLTGRSLSTFKRDFEKIFKLTPSRWLLQKRLQEAYYMIKEKRQTASDIYLELGFEDFSHFSFAFKKQFGVAPSMV